MDLAQQPVFIFASSCVKDRQLFSVDWIVQAATRVPSTTACDKDSPRASAATVPEKKASPAPQVSTTATFKAGCAPDSPDFASN